MKRSLIIILFISTQAAAALIHTSGELIKRPYVKESVQELHRIIADQEYALVRFSRTGCPACTKSSMRFKEFAEKLPENIFVMEINCSQTRACSSFNVHSVPRYILFHNGKVVGEFGNMHEELKNALTKKSAGKGKPIFS